MAGGSLDGVVANLPYIARGELAGLAGNGAGLRAGNSSRRWRRWTRSRARLAWSGAGGARPGGWLFLEIGAAQGPAAEDWLSAQGYVGVEIKADLAGRARVAIARTPGGAGTPAMTRRGGYGWRRARRPVSRRPGGLPSICGGDRKADARSDGGGWRGPACRP